VATTLLAEPRWSAAAQALVDACIDLPTDEDRVAVLVAVCESLGDEFYPAFLRVLSIVGKNGEHAARAAVANALVHALRTGRLPSGRRSAWGASAQQADASFGSRRSLGPIEYLCAWHAQADPSEALNADQFYQAACAVMDLIASSQDARLLYCEKLLADVNDPLGGALTRQTREALRALATAWSEGASATDACSRFLSANAGRAERKLSTLLGEAAFAPR
jgi:hypothetical protein